MFNNNEFLLQEKYLWNTSEHTNKKITKNPTSWIIFLFMMSDSHFYFPWTVLAENYFVLLIQFSRTKSRLLKRRSILIEIIWLIIIFSDNESKKIKNSHLHFAPCYVGCDLYMHTLLIFYLSFGLFSIIYVTLFLRSLVRFLISLKNSLFSQFGLSLNCLSFFCSRVICVGAFILFL